jgi:HK97 family phage portal protein
MSIWGTLQDWVGRSFGLRDGSAPIYAGRETDAGEVVTAHGAMQLSAFHACVRLISQTIATLPLGIFERRADGEKIARPDHWLYPLLHDSPNADQTAVEFWEARCIGLCTAGNGYAEKVPGSNGRIAALNHMPADTYVRRLDSGALQYRYYEYGREYVLPEERVFHVRAFGGGEQFWMGMSPVAYARQTLGLARATDRAAAQTFSGGMRAKGFLTTPGSLSPDQRDQVRKSLVDPFMGPFGKQWGVLEADFDFKTINISPRDAELIMSRKFNIEDLCRWHGVPPVLIGHSADGQTMWGSGIEQIMLAWLTLGLRPYLERIEQAINKRLIPAAERGTIFAEFNVEGLLRATSQARAEYYSKLIGTGMLKPNEGRSKENLPLDPDGNVLLINSTLIPLSMAGKQTPAKPAASPDNTDTTPAVANSRRIKIVDVTKHDSQGRILQTVTREIEEPILP